MGEIIVTSTASKLGTSILSLQRSALTLCASERVFQCENVFPLSLDILSLRREAGEVSVFSPMSTFTGRSRAYLMGIDSILPSKSSVQQGEAGWEGWAVLDLEFCLWDLNSQRRTFSFWMSGSEPGCSFHDCKGRL